MKSLKKNMVPAARSRQPLSKTIAYQGNLNSDPVFHPPIRGNMGTGPAKILVISDHPTGRSVLRKELQAAHYDVITAGNDAEALSLAVTILPDLIIYDMALSSIGVVGVQKRLKDSSVTQSIPIIFLTAAHRGEEFTSSPGLGPIDYLIKPYPLRELRSRIQKSLVLRQQQQKFHEEIQQFKSRFISRVSDELRNHVTVIAGFASLLEQKQSRLEPSVSFAYLQEIIQHTDCLTDLADGFEGLVRTEPLFEEICLIRTLQAVVEKFRHRVESKGKRLDLKLPIQNRLLLMGNQQDLFTAFSHLLSNAHKLTDPGGTITVRVRPMEGQARIEVTHTGTGLSTEQPWRESLDEDSGPLGLTIARSIAARHNGSLGVEIQPGQENNFWMVLPLSRHPVEVDSGSGSQPAVSSPTPFPRR